MAERINWNKFDPSDPRFLELDTSNPNTNISASKFDPTDPTADVKNPSSPSARYNEFLQTANVGDTFDFGGGVQTKFVGFNKVGTPIIQTIESPERQNWRGTMASATSFADAVSKLKGAGFDSQMAQFLVTQSGTSFADQAKFLAANQATSAVQIGATANGTPIYGYDPDGKPITDPKKLTNSASAVAGTNTATGGVYTGAGSMSDPFKLNGANFTGTIGGVNYVNGLKEDTSKRTAQQEFRAVLGDFGLADLADVVDGLIRDDLSVSQIRLQLPKTESYKARFPGMEALRAAGQAVNEATYISMEKGYMQTLQAYGLDTKTLGGRKQLGTYIANLVSPREFEERVNLAATRVKDNADVISQFKTYYPEVDNSALTAYLLNPTVGMDIIKKQVRLAEIGAAAMDVGFATGVSLSTAEELRGAVGEQDYQTVRSAFAQAKVLSDQQARLARIEGTNYSQNEAIQGIVGKDIQSQMASQKRAERETMTRFGGRSGVTSTSLRGDTEI
jgi:hypothetical protein